MLSQGEFVGSRSFRVEVQVSLVYLVLGVLCDGI